MKTITQNEFETEVLKSPLPVLVDFFTTSCKPCVLLMPILEELAAENAKSLKMVKVNAGENTTLANSYRVQSVPTLLLFSKGNVVAQSLGQRGKKDIQKWLAESLAGCR